MSQMIGEPRFRIHPAPVEADGSGGFFSIYVFQRREDPSSGGGSSAMEILLAMEVPPEAEVLLSREVLPMIEILLVRKVLLEIVAFPVREVLPEMVMDILDGR